MQNAKLANSRLEVVGTGLVGERDVERGLILCGVLQLDVLNKYKGWNCEVWIIFYN